MKFKAGEATIEIRPLGEAEAAERKVSDAEFAANERKLSAIRKDALREHYEEFVIVSDWGKNVRYYPTEEAFIEAIWADDCRAAAHAYLVEFPKNLIV